MPIVKVNMSDDHYDEAVKMRKREGLPSVPALLLYKCGLLDDEHEATEITRMALLKAKQLKPKEEFKLRDLFKPEDWNYFSKKARLRAGRLFCDHISASKDGIRALRKAGSGHQVYQKM